ncbi:histidine kinase osmosensor [Marasmius crinis-equi]|uniref:Histidine kinase osmosensor n=1 Tax=Marasmius crinis-equi TaxID=585013 RepID=A0ABR3EN35_9AGAR
MPRSEPTTSCRAVVLSVSLSDVRYSEFDPFEAGESLEFPSLVRRHDVVTWLQIVRLGRERRHAPVMESTATTSLTTVKCLRMLVSSPLSSTPGEVDASNAEHAGRLELKHSMGNVDEGCPALSVPLVKSRHLQSSTPSLQPNGEDEHITVDDDAAQNTYVDITSEPPRPRPIDPRDHLRQQAHSWRGVTAIASRILDFGAGTPGSPLVVASGGALATAAMESGLSAVEELMVLKAQVQDVARVCKAVADGDLTQKITVPVQGVVMVILRDVINTMVDKLGQFAKEVTRVSQEVGTEGKLGGQAPVLDVEGTWRELTGVVNKLAANLTGQVRSIAKVTKAVALGDSSKQIEVDAWGEILDLKNTVNGMVVRLRALAAEVTRVTLEVGSQGKLGGQANVPDVEGVWFELVRNVSVSWAPKWRGSKLTISVDCYRYDSGGRGDLTQKIEIQVEGEMATLKKTVNNMVDQLGAFASEVTRVALEVGTQGILGGQARVEGVQGTWADLTRNVNKMASNPPNQVRSISEVTKAVAQGNLSKFVEVDVQGEMLDLKETVNSMVVQLSTFSNEVTRVSLEVGTEGILGGQAFVPDVQGEWKSLTDNVNLMAMNLTNQVRSIAEVTKAVASGDLSKKIVVDVKGEIADLKETVNEMTESLSVFADEVTRVAREVGTEGKLGGQARVAKVAGTSKALTDNLTLQVRTIAVATTALARGDLTQKIGGVSVSGEMLNLVNTINDMIDQLSIFAVEVKKVAREVGTEGKLGVQAEVGNVQGFGRRLPIPQPRTIPGPKAFPRLISDHDRRVFRHQAASNARECSPEFKFLFSDLTSRNAKTDVERHLNIFDYYGLISALNND